MLWISTSTLASAKLAKKSEIVYVNLDEYGSVELINVYNKFSGLSAGEIVDYASYSEVTNLTNHDTSEKIENAIKWNIAEGTSDFSYMGKLSNEASQNIPWNVDISYKLNGEDKNASDLVGEKGLVKITIDVSENENANEYFRNRYMLEITSSYDMTEYISVYSKDAIEVLTGNTKTLMLIALPGQSKTFEIEIGSNNFSMDGITFAMVPLQGEIFDKLSEISEDKKDLEDAIDSLNASMDILLNNTASMNSANAKLISGAKNIKTASNKLQELAASRNQNIEDLSKDLNELSRITTNAINDIENLQTSVDDVNQMVSDLQEKMPKLIGDLEDVSEALERLEDAAEDLPDDLKDIKKLVGDTSDLIKSAETVLKAQASGQNVDTSDIEVSLKAIAALAAEYGAKAQQAEDLAQAAEYAKIAKTLQTNLQTIQSEMESIEGSVSSGLSGVKNLVSGMSKVEKDLNTLEENINSLSKDAKNLPEDIEAMQNSVDTINEILKITNENLEKYLEKKENVADAVTHLNEAANELQEINTHATNILSHVQSMTKILDNELYSAATDMADGMTELLNKTQNIANQSNSIKQSKNTVYNVTKNRLDEISDETNIFEINSDAEIVSFTSSENEAPETVQILLKSKDIKGASFVSDGDLEPEEEKSTIWEKIVNVFKIIGNWFKKLFGGK